MRDVKDEDAENFVQNICKHLRSRTERASLFANLLGAREIMFLRAMVISLKGDISMDSVNSSHFPQSFMILLSNCMTRFAARSKTCVFGVFDIQFAY